MAMMEDTFYLRSVAALAAAELPDADPRPVAQWAREAAATRRRGIGVIVAESGELLAPTFRLPMNGSDPYAVNIEGRPVGLSQAMSMARSQSGGVVAHIRVWEVCEGAVPPRPERGGEL